jgi:ubiquinol-cytochrome c reductase cytochrome b subunit
MGWLEHRAGIRKLIALLLLEGVPGGARWRYVWGSCLAFVFSIQLITGILLMTAYSPSSSQAWSSVHFIQYQMDFGWLIRGLHHFGSQTMVVLIAVHMLQVVIAGAHLPPREVNWWLGIGLLMGTFGLSLTGYLLPWDQKGYWATRVATNIASNIPVLGDDIKQLAVGGPDYGNHTLTRFYALHVGILPLAMIALITAHIAIFRRHGVTSSVNPEGLVARPENEHAPGSEPFWPRQAFYDMVACMAVFSIMLGLVLYGFGHEVEPPEPVDGGQPSLYDQWAKAGQRGKGADLDAAADRDTADYPARPEWYFLFLFQLLKYFPGDQKLIGTVYIPNGIVLLLILLPLFGYGPFRKIGHFLGMLVMMTLLILVGMLTLFALRDDNPDGILWGLLKNTDPKALDYAKHHQEGVEKAELLAKRACQLAMHGTPVEGGHMLIRNDPLTTGQKLFQQKCGSCHNFTHLERDKIRGTDEYQFESWTGGKSASDLGNFGSKEWVLGILENSLDDKYFGLVKQPLKQDKEDAAKDKDGKPETEHALVGMRGWKTSIKRMRENKKKPWTKQEIEEQEEQFKLIAEMLVEQSKPREKRTNDELIMKGLEAFGSNKNKCADCHRIEVKEKLGPNSFKWTTEGGETAPELANYGSAEWIRGMIMRPGHKTRHSEKNFMPAFRNLEGPGSEIHNQEFRETNPDTPENMIQHLSDVDRELIIRWILRDYRPVFGGIPVAK